MTTELQLRTATVATGLSDKPARRGLRRWRVHLVWLLLTAAAAVVPVPNWEFAPSSAMSPSMERQIEQVIEPVKRETLTAARAALVKARF